MYKRLQIAHDDDDVKITGCNMVINVLLYSVTREEKSCCNTRRGRSLQDVLFIS